MNQFLHKSLILYRRTEIDAIQVDLPIRFLDQTEIIGCQRNHSTGRAFLLNVSTSGYNYV